MPLSLPAERIEHALTTATPFEALLSVAQQLRDEGVPQSELLALYDSFRERHATDTNETLYDAVLDTMDFIVGWCSPSRALYPDGNQVAYAPAPPVAELEVAATPHAPSEQ
jgi:hypothetical protein